MSFDSLYGFIGSLNIPSSLSYFLFGYRGGNLVEYMNDCERLSLPGASQDTEEPSGTARATAAAIDEWISDPDNFRHDFTLGEMADSTGISRRQIMKYFKDGGLGDFRAWKVSRKIQIAMQIMEDNPRLTISEVADAVGFKDKSNFHRQFTRITGDSPRKWRQNLSR